MTGIQHRKIKPRVVYSALDYWLRRNLVTVPVFLARVKKMDPDGVGISDRMLKHFRRAELLSIHDRGRKFRDGSVRLALLICAATNWEVNAHELVSAAWLRTLEYKRREWLASITRAKRRASAEAKEG